MEEENNLIGKQIGNYYLIEEIESGSSCTVYRAHHIYLPKRIVALKVLHTHLPTEEWERFIQEAQFLESLHHPHILSVADMGFDNGRLYLASEYASGGSLRELLHEKHLLPWDQVQTILIQVGEALCYAHQKNIVHCDLKPENILFNAQGEAVLADFGMAKVLSTMSTKQLTIAEGTPLYMAPEQFHGQVSKESDQYALGCIAYELLTGQEIFSAPDFDTMGYNHEKELPIPPHQINPFIPLHIEQAILKALAKQRHERHQDVAAFLAALHTAPKTTKEEWLVEGNALYDMKRYEEALLAYDQALRLDPDNADAYYGKGIALEDLERYDEALEAFEQALDLDANNAAAYTIKRASLRNLEQYKEALVAHEQALDLDPTTKLATERDLEQYEITQQTYQPALRLDPSHADAYYSKSLTLDHLGRFREAQYFRKKAKELGWA